MSEPIWIVTPVYLDVPSFRAVRERVLGALGGHPLFAGSPVNFVAVDDTAGVDPQVAGLADLGDVTIVEPPFNLGHQRAIVYALRRIADRLEPDDLVVTMDADGEDAPEDVPRLLEELLATGSERALVLALRTSRNEGLAFKAFYILFRLLFRVLTGTEVRSGNFAAYRGWVARRALSHPSFDLCYSSTLTTLSLTRRYVPCARAERLAGQSRMSTTKLITHGISMLMPFLDRIATRALMAFTLVIGACLLLGAAVLGARIFTEEAIPGWATSTLLALAITSLVALGNFVVLFAVYSQSRSVLLSHIDEQDHGSGRSPDEKAAPILE